MKNKRLALGFLAATLMHPAIHVAIVGIKTPAQIREAVGAENFLTSSGRGRIPEFD